MADCGASGTALDHATRAYMGGGGNGQEAAQKLGSFLGHAALSGASVPGAVALSRPDHIAFPNGAAEGDALLAIPSSSSNHHIRQNHPTASRGPVWHGHAFAMSQQQNHNHTMMMPNRNEQIQQHSMAIQQQYHQQMMMMQHHQQHQMMMQAKARAMEKNHEAQVQAQAQFRLSSTKISQLTHNGTQEDFSAEVDGYTEEGNVQRASIDALAAAWAEAQDGTQAQDEQTQSHDEGNVQGASIEELAAAWAEAQDEYYQSEEFNNPDPSEFWIDANDLNYAPTYKFVNEVVRGNADIPPETNFMEQGLKYFKEGDLMQAIKNFEMELQLNDPDNATAWRMLGRCHAENDQDREAIVCLEIAVERDPFSPESQLALGVSYVNELNHVKALSALKSWITMNPKYAGLLQDDIGDDVYGDGQNGASRNDSDFQELQNLLLKALEFDDSDAADVWEALGVAANVSRDFETAVEAFQKAIEARPDDYQLWNKLGATLANGSQSNKALPAYHKALQLKPKYARAWLNMAISHSNLQDFDEAARCYLQTLSLNPAAVHCWSYLRVALSCSERWDLIPFAASQNLDAFKEHYDFVMYDRPE